MYEAFWDGLFDVRWEEAPLGPECHPPAGWDQRFAMT